VRLIYFGTSGFAVPALQAIASHVVMVVTQPERPAGRGRELHKTPIHVAALELGLKIVLPKSAREPKFIDEIRKLQADALIVASYGQILPEALLLASTRGGINLHASLLPAYRGAAPIQRAILAGESKTGVTLMQMDAGMDTGDIIASTTTAIGPDETAGELEIRLASIAAEMLVNWLPKIVEGNYSKTPQNTALATYAPKLSRQEGEIGFELTNTSAYNRFRACTPRPGCFIQTKFGQLRILGARLSEYQGSPGKIIKILPNHIVVGFSKGAIEFHSVQLPGRSPVAGASFAHGQRIKVGEFLIDQNV
jgi:methionyl-tRNA formyltransferase